MLLRLMYGIFTSANGRHKNGLMALALSYSRGRVWRCFGPDFTRGPVFFATLLLYQRCVCVRNTDVVYWLRGNRMQSLMEYFHLSFHYGPRAPSSRSCQLQVISITATRDWRFENVPHSIQNLIIYICSFVIVLAQPWVRHMWLFKRLLVEGVQENGTIDFAISAVRM